MRARERAAGSPPIEEIIPTPAWMREKYRTLRYTQNEIEGLADQLARMLPARMISECAAR